MTLRVEPVEGRPDGLGPPDETGRVRLPAELGVTVSGRSRVIVRRLLWEAAVVAGG